MIDIARLAEFLKKTVDKKFALTIFLVPLRLDVIAHKFEERSDTLLIKLAVCHFAHFEKPRKFHKVKTIFSDAYKVAFGFHQPLHPTITFAFVRIAAVDHKEHIDETLGVPLDIHLFENLTYQSFAHLYIALYDVVGLHQHNARMACCRLVIKDFALDVLSF